MTAERTESFEVDLTGHLVRTVVPRRGQPYEHRCPIDVFENVAHTIDEMAGAPFTLIDLHQRTNQPWTAINVAFAFLKERGIVEAIRGRKHVANGDAMHLDAMIEYHALREEPKPI